MKLYLAGLYTSNFDLHGRLFSRLTEEEKRHRLNVRYILESYHYIHRASYVNKIRRDEKKVFLDSGAFSAFTKGVEVDLEAYCRYIRDNMDIIEVASVLDGIGDPLQTWQNQRRMEQLGTAPLPCFHYGEDERYLKWYVDNYEYITLGGMVPISTPQLKLWLDEIWKHYLTDSSGRPKLKVHGFGLTTISLMERYPWYSVDSSSWVQIAANGGILLPDHGVISVSKTSSAAKQEGRHINTLPKPQQKAVAAEIEKLGFDVERVQTEYITRWVFNCAAFEILNRRYAGEDKIFVGDQMGLFDYA
jgi:hypothetical protein